MIDYIVATQDGRLLADGTSPVRWWSKGDYASLNGKKYKIVQISTHLTNGKTEAYIYVIPVD